MKVKNGDILLDRNGECYVVKQGGMFFDSRFNVQTEPISRNDIKPKIGMLIEFKKNIFLESVEFNKRYSVNPNRHCRDVCGFDEDCSKGTYDISPKCSLDMAQKIVNVEWKILTVDLQRS